mgnify:CR=1 FL=1
MLNYTVLMKTINANKSRKKASIDFALEIYGSLIQHEQQTGTSFESLGGIVNFLNYSKKIRAKRGGKWTTTQVRRVLDMAKDNSRTQIDMVLRSLNEDLNKGMINHVLFE